MAEDIAEAQRVRIKVRAGAVICQLSECPAGERPCPQRSMMIEFWAEQNRESQHCVRELIEQLGGQSNPMSDWLINMFEADLTWNQVQQVAQHPHVEYISGDNYDGDAGGGFN